MNNETEAQAGESMPADPSAAAELAELTRQAGAADDAVSQASAPVSAPSTYPYNEADAGNYASMVAVGLGVWSARWRYAEPLSAEEIDQLSTAAGRYIAWKFPGSGEEAHPLMALLSVALLVGVPRGFQVFAAKKAEAQVAATKKDDGDGHNAGPAVPAGGKRCPGTPPVSRSTWSACACSAHTPARRPRSSRWQPAAATTSIGALA